MKPITMGTMNAIPGSLPRSRLIYGGIPTVHQRFLSTHSKKNQIPPKIDDDDHLPLVPMMVGGLAIGSACAYVMGQPSIRSEENTAFVTTPYKEQPRQYEHYPGSSKL